MNDKIRILFSNETGDRWILNAYKKFFDALPDDRHELYCTSCGVDEPVDVLRAYNIVDYAKFSRFASAFSASELASAAPKEVMDEARKSALWSSPERILERLFLFKLTASLLQPDVAIVWNGMADIRRMVRISLSELGIPFFYAEKGMLPDSWYVDEKGINACCSLDSSSFAPVIRSAARQDTEDYITRIVGSGSSAWEQPSRVGGLELSQRLRSGPDSRLIFFPGQVDEDVNITQFSPFENVSQAVELVLKSIAKKDSLVVKPHPKACARSREHLLRLASNHENLVVVEDANIWDLIEISDLVISINSTVAFEALLRRKKALVLGDGVLSKTGLLKKVDCSVLGARIRDCLSGSFESLVGYLHVLSLVEFLKSRYYIFRDSASVPTEVAQRLAARVKHSLPKVFTRDMLMAMVYGPPAKSDGRLASRESGGGRETKARPVEAATEIREGHDLSDGAGTERRTVEDVRITNLLDEIAARCGTDKSPLGHDYTRHYYRHFAALREKPLKFLEIGIGKGGSLKTWQEFFPRAEIFGIDTNPTCRAFAGGRVKIFIGDQADERFLQSFVETAGGPFDIVIDDGGHFMDQQITSLKTLFPYVKPGGTYVIEDLHTSYWEKYGGGIGRPNTTVEFLKNLLDEVNCFGGAASRNDPAVRAAAQTGEWDALVKNIEAVHFSRSICFISKRCTPTATLSATDSAPAAVGTVKSGGPLLSVVLTTYDRPELLHKVLEGFAGQTVPRADFEVVVADDGSVPPVREVAERFESSLNIKYVQQQNNGLAAARNTGLRAAEGDIVLFSDDDDVPAVDLVAEHLRSHQEHPDERTAVLGHLDWHPDLEVTPVMHYVTKVGGEYLGFARLQDGQLYDAWKWWGGLISAKRSLLARFDGPFDHRLRFGYEDTELACRLLEKDVKVLYNARAKSHILKPIDFADFCKRRYLQGRALYRVAVAHPELIIPRYKLEHAEETYRNKYASHLDNWSDKVTQFESLLKDHPHSSGPVPDRYLEALYVVYRECFIGHWLTGYVDEKEAVERGRLSLASPVNLPVPTDRPAESVVSRAAIRANGAPGAVTRHRVQRQRDVDWNKPDCQPTTRPLRIAFVNTHMPCFDVTSSSLRIYRILKILVAAGHRIDHLYSNCQKRDKAYKAAFDGAINFIKAQESVCCFRDYLHFRQAAPLDFVWMTNLWTIESLRYAWELTRWLRANCPETKVIIDTMDLHCEKHARRYELSRDPEDLRLAQTMLEIEKQLYPIAHKVLAVTEVERQHILQHAGSGCRVEVVPNIHTIRTVTPDLARRKDMCFLGSFCVRHNVDAVKWFLRDVLPLILQKAPDVKFHIMGFRNEEHREKLETLDSVKVIGYVEDAERAVANYRLFVCPMIYGAGMKGKLGIAAATGTPFVTTTIGAEGFDFVEGEHCSIAEAPAEFAEKCVRLLRDDALWHRFSSRSRELLARRFSVKVVTGKLLDVLETEQIPTAAGSAVGREPSPVVAGAPWNGTR